jgi:hypothetical protein
VIAVFGRDSEASRWHAASVCGARCAAAAAGTSITARTNTERMRPPLLATGFLHKLIYFRFL